MALYLVVTPHSLFVQPPGNPLALTKARDLPPGGNGYLAGEFPDGITTVGGAPVAATVRILYRPESAAPGDGVVVAEVQSAADGTWRVDGLNPSLRYDVVGRKSGFNDTIMANIAPTLE
ncbi:hypothetical protein [Pseudomonas aeruginosa]|uniref:hypothetical protein n=1 Tax=Pseudomonas aeruginosa TaxID=287 RepID=UPI000F8735E9|nr:hypothetical protein [Pseudomonas aeruginosa]RSZ54061.1 hypothetical protein EJU38_05490 [Pseudomonas aeruginosa]WOT60875.1 hypothetical protein R5018_25110 [Pseudomonas aeruginosa]WOT74317.1 hypothetical protein R5026_27845 [Pseudomonas aeruginosa]WOT85438.1 hypothetical protein R5020_18805 [Pseudomonas aeruginosa]WOT98393.1 hypothetical protein R5015_18740 [Pseudomonas aeruginosa]